MLDALDARDQRIAVLEEQLSRARAEFEDLKAGHSPA
jgi:uncharacterized small protein (DUF1192 family)